MLANNSEYLQFFILKTRSVMESSAKSRGGIARAEALSEEEKSAIGRRGAEARWGPDESELRHVERALVADSLALGDVEIPCAVLDDGTRVLSERGIAKGIGRTRSGSHWKKKNEQGAQLPLYLSANNLKPYISNDLIKALSEPRWYKSPHGGRPVAGVPATCLPDICDAWVQADVAGVLTKPQKKIAASARALIRAFAKAGIVALVDEATGYQEYRAKDELQVLLRAYLSEELLPWAQRFPMTYYQEMFRLWNWEWPPRSGIQGPRFAGKLTKKIIYEQLPAAVVAELEALNPPDENWRRKDKNHQYLTENIGQPHLEQQVAVATNLMKVCDDKDEFMEKFERAFPGTFKKGQQLRLKFQKKTDDDE